MYVNIKCFIKEPDMNKDVLNYDGKGVLEENEILISPSAFCVDKDDVWVVHARLNVFFNYNLKSKKTKMFGLHPYGKTDQESQYKEIYSYGDKLFFIPAWESRILVFHKTDCKISVLDEDSTVGGRFSSIFVVDNFLYCIPFHQDYFLKINMDTEEIISKWSWKNKLFEERDYINNIFFDGKAIYCTVIRKKDLLLRVSDEKTESIKLKTNGEIFSSGCIHKGKLYLNSLEKDYVCEFDDIGEKPKLIKKPARGFSVLQSIRNKYLILENYSTGEIAYLDETNGFTIKRLQFGTISWLDSENFRGLLVSNLEKDFYYNRRDNVLYEIDDDMNILRHYVKANEIEMKELAHYTTEIFLERKMRSLKEYLDYLEKNKWCICQI